MAGGIGLARPGKTGCRIGKRNLSSHHRGILGIGHSSAKRGGSRLRYRDGGSKKQKYEGEYFFASHDDYLTLGREGWDALS